MVEPLSGGGYDRRRIGTSARPGKCLDHIDHTGTRRVCLGEEIVREVGVMMNSYPFTIFNS